MALPHTFAPLPGPIPLAYLDDNFSYVLGQIMSSTGLGLTLVKDFGAVGDGIADDTTPLVNAIAGTPEGGTLVLNGLIRITSTVTVNRRISIVCLGANQGIIVDVGAANDGLIFLGTDPTTGWGLNDIYVILYAYGAANCCMHAVTFARTDRATHISVNCHAGATAYGFRWRGAISNHTVRVVCSVNFNPPPLPITPAMPAISMVVDNYGVPTASFVNVTVSGPATPAVVTETAHGRAAGSTVVFGGTGVPPSPFVLGKPYYVVSPAANTYNLAQTSGGTAINSTAAGTSCQLATCTQYASNDNHFNVILEGAGQGYVQAPMPGEGDNILSGQIEGTNISPFFVEDSLGFCTSFLHMEANSQPAIIKNSAACVIGEGTKTLGTSVITLQNCRGYTVASGYGKVSIDSACSGGGGTPWSIPDIDGFVCADTSFVQMAGIANSTNGLVMAGGPGHPSMETLFVNPFFDIFDTVASNVGPPISVTQPAGYVAGDMVLETGTTYSKSINPTAMKCISRGTTFPNAARVTPGVQPWRGSDWVSIHTGVYMLSSSFKVLVYIFDGVTYKLIGKTKSSGVYETIAGSAQLIDGNNWYVQFTLMNAAETNYVSLVQYYVGGLNVVKGALPPSGVGNSSGRMNYIGSSISNTPFRQGAKAVNGGNIYEAVSNGSPTDWLRTNN